MPFYTKESDSGEKKRLSVSCRDYLHCPKSRLIIPKKLLCDTASPPKLSFYSVVDFPLIKLHGQFVEI